MQAVGSTEMSSRAMVACSSARRSRERECGPPAGS
jgi:hypothetical protein